MQRTKLSLSSALGGFSVASADQHSLAAGLFLFCILKINRRRLQTRQWKSRNLAKSREATERWRMANKAKLKVDRKNHYLKNKAHENATTKKYHRAHTEEARIYAIKWRRANPERFMRGLRRRVARWEKKNPGAKTARTHKRRALLKSVTIDPRGIIEFTTLVRSRRFIRCYYCDGRVTGKDAHIDHVVALSGAVPGKHEVGNLCASCPKCNLKKSAKPISEWEKPGQQILAI